MKLTMHPDMIEATRLTREGRLTEATALLQRMLQSGMEPEVRTEGPRAAAADAPRAGAAPIIELTPAMMEVSAPRRSAPPIIELTPEVIEVSAPRPSAPTGSAEADLDGSEPGNRSALARTAMPDWVRVIVGCVSRV